MSCFCTANVSLLPNLSLDASLTLSATAQVALDLHAQLAFALPSLPDIPAPPFALPELIFSIDSLASLVVMAQLSTQASVNLGLDMSASLGATALARLTATLQARMDAIAGLNLDLQAWIDLARVNAAALELTAVFNACEDAASGALPDPSADAFNFVVVPPSWGGLATPLLSLLVSITARLGLDLDAELIATMQAQARAIARATETVSLDAVAATSLLAGVSAIARLSVSLGVNPLEEGFASVRARVAANFSAMASAAARLGIDLTLGIPSLPSIPGLTLALVVSLTARLRAAADAAAALNASLDVDASFELDISASVLLAASVTASLTAVLDVSVALPAPCGMCDLRSVMAALPGPGEAAAAPGEPTNGAPASPGTTPASSQNTPSAQNPGAAPAAAGGGTDGSAAGGGGGGGGGGGSGGGGVPATVMSAQLMCTMGMAPAALTVLPVNRTTISSMVAANIMDHAPLVNILPFGMCMSPANPVVAAATAAALGVLTPMPCIPATSAPWTPGAATVMLGNMPMLDATSMCMCNWAGVITIVSPGQMQATIP